MPLTSLSEWIEEHADPKFIWYVKRLSANDTQANKAHQAGPYINKQFLFRIFPSLNQPQHLNPRKEFELQIDSHPDARKVCAIWYNNKFHGKTRNETRLTNFGGQTSVLLDPDSTGSLAVFAFRLNGSDDVSSCQAWICEYEIEADLVEDLVGPVEPGKYKLWSSIGQQTLPILNNCWLTPDQIPVGWLTRFPSGAEIIRKTVELRTSHGLTPDQCLIRRRDCEYEIFRSIEEAVELPVITQGFSNIEEFIARAQTILQRRKARSGRSLELHVRQIFLEQGLKEGVDFEYQPESESGKKPDFLFPSQAAYQNQNFANSNLKMLAVKTTCKDRWRQILTEADRIPHKHLLTLQEGISVNQHQEMLDKKVQLVVPASLVAKYPASIRPNLQTLESFIADVRLLA